MQKWGLHELLEISAALNLIKAETAAQLRISKQFRNLVHPGKAVRMAMKCDRGTALAAVAGMELVVRDLS